MNQPAAHLPIVSYSADLNAVEAMLLSHRENTHSALLAWLLRTPTIELAHRAKLLRALVPGLPANLLEITTQTEWQNVDVLVRVTRVNGRQQLVGIENKLKATEGAKQLATYAALLATEAQVGAMPVHHVYLSLAGRPPRDSPAWTARSYAHLLSGLRTMTVATDNVYARDYRDAVERLVGCLDLLNDAAFRPFVFRQTGPPLLPGLAAYFSSANLQMPLQREWMEQLASDLHKPLNAFAGWHTEVGETNQSGFLNVVRPFLFQGQKVSIGLQLQNCQLKAFARPEPYLEIDATPAINKLIERLIAYLAQVPGMIGRASKPQGKGFSSVKVAPKFNYAAAGFSRAVVADLMMTRVGQLDGLVIVE